MLSAEKIQSNWDRYLNEIKTNISKERTDILIPFMEKYKERFEELRNIITISNTGNYGARGVQNTRPL